MLHRRDCDASPSTNKALSLYSWYQHTLARIPNDRPVIGEENWRMWADNPCGLGLLPIVTTKARVAELPEEPRLPQYISFGTAAQRHGNQAGINSTASTTGHMST